jgi:serine/threonine-protein phosphatase CPPED1
MEVMKPSNVRTRGQTRRVRVTAGLALVALVLVGACRSSLPFVESRPFFFIQMADPQFGFFTANQDFARETVNFGRAIAAANRLRPAFVVVCGDLVHRVGDAAQIAEYRRIAAQLDPSIPLYNVPGNHDVANLPTPATVAAYRQVFGPDYYTFERSGLYGIVINSSLIKDPSGAPAEAAAHDAWIRSTVQQARQSGRELIMVFQHHPWFLAQPDEPDQYYNLPLERRLAYLDLFRANGISHIFAGHYHRNAFGRAGVLEMVTTGPVGKPQGADSSGLRIVIVRGRNVEHRYFPLDSLPQRVVVTR